MFNVAKTEPKVGLYIECGKLPVNFITKMRRIMYYWHILTRNEEELLFKFFSVQKYSPSEGDWVCQVKKDMALAGIKLQLCEAEIKSLSKCQFQVIVKNKIERLAIEH